MDRTGWIICAVVAALIALYKPFLCLLSFDPPTSPRKLEILEITHNAAIIKWAAPEYVGGTSITRYIVEMKGGSDIPYQKIAEVDGKTDQCHINSLMDARGYCVRVTAENLYGKSEPIVSLLVTTEKEKDWSETLKYVGGAVLGGTVAAAAAPVAIPAVLAAAGFTAKGIAAGSAAASVMASYGGTVASGSLLATAQSIGAAGLGALGTTVSGTVGAVVGSIFGWTSTGSKEGQTEEKFYC